MSINNVRARMYRAAKILGDLNAILRGKVARRVTRRIVGKFSARGLGKVFHK